MRENYAHGHFNYRDFIEVFRKIPDGIAIAKINAKWD